MKESVWELQKFLEAINVGLMAFQQIIHTCGLPSQSKAIEICGCSPAMQNYYFKPLKQSFQTQLIDENFTSTSKGLGQGAEFMWVNGPSERNEMLMPFYMGDYCEDFAKSSRLFVKARQVIFIFVDKVSGHFPSVTCSKEMDSLPENPLHPFTWGKVFSSQDPSNILHEVTDPLPESSLQQILPSPPPPAPFLSDPFEENVRTQTLFEELDNLLPDLSKEENEENMKYFDVEDICLTCFQLRDEACHCHETSCEGCFSL